MNEKPRSLLLGLLAIIWAAGGLNYLVISRGWSAGHGFILWLAVLLPLVGALVLFYQQEQRSKGYKRAPFAKMLIGLIYGGIAAGISIKSIKLITEGYYLALSGILGAALVGVVALFAVRSSYRDFRSVEVR